ncbi:MAG: sporulation protein YunB [Clostridia bacterium]|nr:sporulation protein YunB [Clostridia bacterium]
MTAWMRRCVLLILILAALALYIEGNLTEVTLSLAQAKARTLAVTVLNETVEEVVQEGLSYDSLVRVITDDRGQVRLLQADTTAMNHLAARVSALAQSKLDSAENRAVQVPLGSALGLTLFAGAGPKLRVQVLPVGAIASRFDTEFQAAGINQTRHRILLTMTATVKLVIPTGAKTVEASTQVAVAESIIVGEVPQSFVDVEDKDDMLNLIP